MTSKTAPDTLRIAVAQLNPTVGDVVGNLAKARAARADAARQGADLVLFTELFISGYPPEDLVLKPAFLAACERAANELAKDTADGGPAVIIGTPLAGERIGDQTFDGNTETAIFPGALPKSVDVVFEDHRAADLDEVDPAVRFVRFRPPKLERTAEGVTLSLPHIRLDRALQFLIGDRLA